MKFRNRWCCKYVTKHDLSMLSSAAGFQALGSPINTRWLCLSAHFLRVSAAYEATGVQTLVFLFTLGLRRSHTAVTGH